MKVVCIGDSLTYGYGIDQKQSWFESVKTYYNVEFINVGIPGNTSVEMKARFEADVISKNPTHVLIMGGSNDVMLQWAVEDTINHLCDMANCAKQHGVIPIMMAPPPVNGSIKDKTWFVDVEYNEANKQLEALADALKAYAESTDIPFVDLFHHYPSDVWQPHYLLDGIHFRKSGHALMHEVIVHVLNKALQPIQPFHPLKVLSVEKTSCLKYLQAYTIQYQTKSGKEKSWEMVSRGGLERLRNEIEYGKMVSDGSVIFATNHDHTEVVLLKEYRVGAGRYVYMLPAGLADEGEDEKVTAVREFKEETGLAFDPVHVEPARYVSIGIINEKVSVVYGYFSGEPSKKYQADNEDAEIMILNRSQVQSILENEEVTIRTALILQDFFRLNPFFERRHV